MVHPIYRVVSFAIVAPYTLRVTFDDTKTQVIDFSPISPRAFGSREAGSVWKNSTGEVS